MYVCIDLSILFSVFLGSQFSCETILEHICSTVNPQAARKKLSLNNQSPKPESPHVSTVETDGLTIGDYYPPPPPPDLRLRTHDVSSRGSHATLCAKPKLRRSKTDSFAIRLEVGLDILCEFRGLFPEVVTFTRLCDDR